MELITARVQNYKSIADSTVIPIEPGITCLVGKNESGKTAILEALYRLKPLPSGHPTAFDGLRDYPRRYYGRDKTKVPSLPVLSATYSLSNEALTKYEGLFGKGAVPRTVSVTKGYDNQRKWNINLDMGAALSHIKSDPRLAGVDLKGIDSEENLVALLKGLESPTPDHAAVLTDLSKTLKQRVYAALADDLPVFLYFSDYDVLPGAASIKRLQTVSEDELEPGERTALSLLRLAGVESEDFTESAYEARKAALEAAANTLTDEVFEYWSQNKDLQVELDIEFRTVDEDGEKLTDPDPWLQIRIRNNRHRVTLNFAERSRGFVWFFSFLAFFSEYRNVDYPVVLLLDEPGLNLHGAAQEDLLRFIEERLAGNHQIVYTTHSPFMIDAEHLERSRLVEDREKEGTVVLDDALGTSGETQFPLHAAIGIRATQTLFLGEHTLLVEGNADLVYLQIMSEYCSNHGRVALDKQWVITPVGGLDKMPTFIALLGSQLDVAALHDSPGGSLQRLQDLVDKGVIDKSRLVATTEFTSGKEADLEDLFDPGWYLGILAAAGVATVSKSDLPPGKARLIKRIETKIGEFSHYRPARYLASNRQELDGLTSAVVDRFEKLFERLNALLTK